MQPLRGVGVAVGSCDSIELARLKNISLDSVPHFITHAEGAKRVRKPLFDSGGIPFERHLVILFSPYAIEVGISEVALCAGHALVSGNLVQFKGFRMIYFTTDAHLIIPGKIDVRLNQTVSCRCGVPAIGGFMVLLDAYAVLF